MTPEEIEIISKQISERVLKTIIKYFDETTKVWEPIPPEQFIQHEVDGFGNIKHSSRKDLLLLQLGQLEAQRQKLIDEEKYELLIELQEIYDKIKKEYDNL
tara:strand:- start:742 stop:1044 length:303 start_codon:yes stop_codon:yes gene_type:complete